MRQKKIQIAAGGRHIGPQPDDLPQSCNGVIVSSQVVVSHSHIGVPFREVRLYLHGLAGSAYAVFVSSIPEVERRKAQVFFDTVLSLGKAFGLADFLKCGSGDQAIILARRIIRVNENRFIGGMLQTGPVEPP